MKTSPAPFGLYDLGSTTVYSARSDARFSYCLHVPGNYQSASVAVELLVVVHGSPRTFMEFRDRFQDFGAAHNTLVLCPLFPVGVGGDGNPDGYKYLSEAGIRAIAGLGGQGETMSQSDPLIQKRIESMSKSELQAEAIVAFNDLLWACTRIKYLLATARERGIEVGINVHTEALIRKVVG